MTLDWIAARRAGDKGLAPTELRCSLDSNMACCFWVGRKEGVEVVSPGSFPSLCLYSTDPGVGEVEVGGGGSDGGDDGREGGRDTQPWSERWERRREMGGGLGSVLVVVGVVVSGVLTGREPVSRMWTRAASRSGMEMASGQSQSEKPWVMGSLSPS